jgi:hypothetical protein
MREQRSRKTLVPSNRQFHHGRSPIVGRLVVLSVCMLVIGVQSPPAQTGKDALCSEFTGQAHGLCTAAVANGCFDDDQSPACAVLTSTWNSGCRTCEGPAPWEEEAARCPCVALFGSAADLFARYLAAMGGDFAQCELVDDQHVTSVFATTVVDGQLIETWS